MKPHGVLVNCDKEDTVGPGGIGFKERKDAASHQYAANPGSVEYKFLLVDVGALVHVLHEYLREHGYTKTLHDHLIDAAKHLEGNGTNDDTANGPSIKINNVVIFSPWLACHCCWGPPRLLKCPPLLPTSSYGVS